MKKMVSRVPLPFALRGVGCSDVISYPAYAQFGSCIKETEDEVLTVPL